MTQSLVLASSSYFTSLILGNLSNFKSKFELMERKEID